MINKTIFEEKGSGTGQQSSKRVMGIFFGVLCSGQAVASQFTDFKVDFQLWVSMLSYSAILLGVATIKNISELKNRKDEKN